MIFVRTMWFGQYRPVQKRYNEQASPENFAVELVSKEWQERPMLSRRPKVEMILSVVHVCKDKHPCSPSIETAEG
jgi:hypothetical protein